MSQFTKDEIKILKYIKKHPHILRSDLLEKFPTLDDAKISGYIYIDNQKQIVENGLDTGEFEITASSDYYLSRHGIIFLENLFNDKIKSYFTPITVTLITNAILFLVKIISENLDKITSFFKSF